LSALAAVSAACFQQWLLATIAALAWLLLTLAFAWRRLNGTRRDLAQVAEITVTSALIPPLSIYWRIYGAIKFRVWFM
jgi:hypothetical protein